MNRFSFTTLLLLSFVMSGCGTSGENVVEVAEDPEAYEREVKAVRELERKN